MIWLIFIKILVNTSPVKNVKYWSYLMIWSLMYILTKIDPMVIELFIRSRKLNISLIFSTKPYFAVPKKIKNKFYLLLYYGNLKQARVSTNCN